MDRWPEHLPRIKQMGFDWIYLNPFHYSGYSGSLYAVKDYYEYHPVFVNANLPEPPAKQLQAFLDAAHAQGIKVMMDLVINHTAFDSVMVQQHPEWFVHGDDGQIKKPGCWDGETWIEWGDLAQIDNASNGGLWMYWLTMMKHYMAMGIDGFRCDAAYHVPSELWRFLIPGAREAKPGVKFFAETLGCRPWELIEMADCGFDYVFNSVRWWDLGAPWFLEQQGRTIGAAPSVGFPESHDTPRLAEELGGNQQAVEQRYAFAALFGTGVMIPVGFEFGFRTKLDVVETYPDAWEEPAFDLTGFIQQVNALKASAPIFNLDGPLFEVNTYSPTVKAYLKATPDAREKALLIVNLDREAEQELHIPRIADAMGVRHVWDVSPGDHWTAELAQEDLHAKLPPSGWHVLRGRLSDYVNPVNVGSNVESATVSC
ncbi:MAG: alpha amylase catalytic region [Cyanobacteria bacterium RYN_339]|nr:alpha amylase catalytic region [Cyanobacteria bacterium RYN_339]